MKVYNQDKTKVLTKYNVGDGRLVEDKIFVKHHAEQKFVPQKSHYELIKEFPNGGKEVKEIIDQQEIPYKEAYDEYEDILVFIEFTEKEKAERQINKLKSLLQSTDYQAIKYAEGELTLAEYLPMKEQRKAWREEINQLEKQQNL